MAVRRIRRGRHALPRKVVFDGHRGRKSPRYDWRRFPRPNPESQAIYLLKACLWCFTGDMGWAPDYNAYRCIQCGWVEWDKPRRREQQC